MGQPVALVTGVAGFVGASVARALAAHGRQVVGIARGSSQRTNLADFPGVLVEADLRDEAAVARAFAAHPADELYHVAADYRLWAPRPAEIRTNNVTMTRVVMRAALAARVPKIVHTSSVATLLPRDRGVSDETHPASEATAIGVYKQAKVAAERLVETMVAEDGLPAVIVNPSTPIGPRDAKPTPTGRILRDAARGRLPAFVETGLNLVHVDDVALGHILAAERGAVGRRYVLGGQNVPLGALLAEVARAMGRRAPRLKLPVTPLVPVAIAAEALARLTGGTPLVTRDELAMSRHHMYYSSARAEAELGYTARDWRAGVADALAWFRAAGMLA